MNREWRSFLQDRNARFEGETFLSFADARREAEAAANATVLAALSDHTLLRVHGADAQSFLNSQLSNDVRHVDAAHSQLAAWCNAKGRIITLVRTFKRDDDYYLLLPADLRETVRERLQRYILRAKVTIEDDDNLVTLGVSGPQADSLLHAALSYVPVTMDDCLTQNGVTLLRLPGVHPRCILIAPVAAARHVMGASGATRRADGPAGLDVARYRRRRATHRRRHQRAVRPADGQPRIVEWCGFQKGCYPGQEIVARMHYLGRLKQRMYRAHVESAVTSGTPIFAPDLPGQSTGAVIASAVAPTGGYDLLAVLQMSSAAVGVLHLGSATGPTLQRLPLPYALPTENGSNEKSTA